MDIIVQVRQYFVQKGENNMSISETINKINHVLTYTKQDLVNTFLLGIMMGMFIGFTIGVKIGYDMIK